MKEVISNNDIKFYVDDEDYDRIIKFKWYCGVKKNGRVQIITIFKDLNNIRHTVSIKNYIKGVHLDRSKCYTYKDGNPFNNSKLNLVTRQRNHLLFHKLDSSYSEIRKTKNKGYTLIMKHNAKFYNIKLNEKEDAENILNLYRFKTNPTTVRRKVTDIKPEYLSILSFINHKEELLYA